MGINWNEAPEGATHWNTLNHKFYKFDHDSVYVDDNGVTSGVADWVLSGFGVEDCKSGCFTPRPTEPKPYTRDEALQFLVERLDAWPAVIADAPLCPGWGWVFNGNHPEFEETNPECPELQSFIGVDVWSVAHGSDFVPFVSLEDAATAEQPAPSGKGDPILGMVLVDLTNRALEGKKKYGEPLKAHNGRNALWDAYQEALDLAMYLRQAIEEQR